MKIAAVKKKMTQVFDETGLVRAGTVVELAVGDRVAVSGISKGKEPGAIGGGGGRAGGRVAKGIRMAGRMGGDRVTVGNLTVLAVDEAKGQMIVSGGIPGRPGTRLEIQKLKARLAVGQAKS